MNIYFGENLKNLRKEKNLTQEKLADFLGVSFQTVSKWERGDTYPDITMLPEIAGFFKISVDDLLGVNRAENEKEILRCLEEYDNLTDGDLKLELILKLKEKFPNDFRILLRYMTCLVHFTEKNPEIISKITAIYENIQQNCNVDKIRISAKRHLVELYRSLAEKNINGITFSDCEKIITELPRLRDAREMFCFFYPESHPERDDKIRETLEEQFLLLHTVFSHYFFYDERFPDDWQKEAFQKEIDFLNFVYDDGNYGKMWRTMIYNYGHLAVRFFRIGDNKNGFANLRKSAELAKKFDSLERKTIMHSKLFEGKEFDKHTLGSTYVSSSQMIHLFTKKYPLSDEIKNSDEFREIIKILEN
ncbi:MAG: helix-turn-helix domain-containing protein [Clostridia bacterium]|nr:helix-turn-helix domain-containing protein [Clostridia bacterium]